LSHTFGEIDFTQMPPESFKSPYSTQSFPVPNTKLSATFITTPPLLTVGTPQSNTPGPLHWEHMLEIQLPSKIRFISFRYGGDTGTLEWSSDSGPGHVLPTLPALVGTIQTREFQLARSEGIRSIKLTSSGEMVLYKLAIGIG
jgi:hypothetical protein